MALIRNWFQVINIFIKENSSYCYLGLGKWVTIPTTYAGGGRCKALDPPPLYYFNSYYLLFLGLEDLALVEKLSNGKVDLTFGR